MSGDAIQIEFRAKTWIYFPLSVIFGGLAAFSLILGPLFLFGVMKDARGAPATDAGIALCSMGIPFGLIFALNAFNIRARQRPILCLCREGIRIVVIGSSSLDGIPMIPAVVRVAWLIISTQGFRQKLFVCPWAWYQDVYVSGMPMARRLTIVASRSLPNYESIPSGAYTAEEVVLAEAAFDTPLDRIADAIKWYANSSQSRSDLPSWHHNSASWNSPSSTPIIS